MVRSLLLCLLRDVRLHKLSSADKRRYRQTLFRFARDDLVCLTRRRSSTSSTTTTSTNNKTSSPMIERYHALVREEGSTVPNPHQLKALDKLEPLRLDLLQIEPNDSLPSLPHASPEQTSSGSSSSLFGGWFGSSTSSDTTSTASSDWLANSSKGTSTHSPTTTQKPIWGVYLHGGVGCGKTFLMNLFYDSIISGPWATNKQQIHFHSFMLSVHQEMHAARSQQNNSNKTTTTATPYSPRSSPAHFDTAGSCVLTNSKSPTWRMP